MKLAIARGLFLAGALGVTSLAVAAWSEPSVQVLQGANDLDYCPLPPVARQILQPAQPDQDLLLFMYGLSQGGFTG